MGRLDSRRAAASLAEGKELLGEARRLTLASGLSEEEWEQALEWARRSPGGGPEGFPVPLLVDSWTYH